jgi:ATP-binding cassette subfamily A (ABC1) protein 3
MLYLLPVLILNFNIKCYPQRHYCFVIILSLIFILGYVETGFLYLQYEVDRAIIKQKSRKANFFDDINVKLRKMPYPPYMEDPLLTAIETYLSLVLMLGFILYVIQTTKNIVYEKERKLKVSLNTPGY